MVEKFCVWFASSSAEHWLGKCKMVDPILPPPPHDMDEETRIAVADLITINRKLRRAVKEREAERSSMRGETEKLRKELANITEFSQQQAEDILAVKDTKKNQHAALILFVYLCICSNS
jgi:Lon protease-like protein